ncbi:hypothetical protein SAXI111661_02880 [Saccharomonospora xinjiangensis]|uniref:hypothetical protein n=1 Tax=Saccharomonospora xinjiangensis TaxID=75294 RepID=UPI00106FFCCB|nr:hypothetical protein [Saccharomonospora xinjiangensis]QBQ59892.1 hypothetical protein EYD13_07640 [Saccharomonospora xinjiangensis]
MNDRRWGFEEAEDWEYEKSGGLPAPVAEPEETLVGQDADQVVQVVVSPEADVVAVRLSPQWRQVVDPRALHTSVLSAANAATVSALARSVEHADLAADGTPPENAGADESALTTRDVQRLLDTVEEELRQFTARLSAIVDQPTQVRSSGGHVQGSAQRGQVLALDIDSAWAGQARHTEIETELTEVLRGLHEASTPQEMSAGPRGSAISELMGLAANPRLLMRRLGMPAPTEPTGEG